MRSAIQIIPVYGIGEIQIGETLSQTILTAIDESNITLFENDVIVITQKIVSKAEGRIIDPRTVEPSHMAHMCAAQGHKDANYYEVVLQESKRIIRMDRGVLICETHHGLICANAGVDESNVDGGGQITLLPRDPDASAKQIRDDIIHKRSVKTAIIISDSFGRAWREGQVNVAIGVAGINPLISYAGIDDPYGYRMQASVLAIGDEIAAAAELVMGKIDRVPVAVVRGVTYEATESSASTLIRPAAKDLFR
ncbi:MAG: coenzyme F420-0:L-glutamate ligase [Roseiflexaceae bacterium]|jgi:coenzyme F420-0:L-glutamate ligase/coenzyme F420-1:gamma-L-glutamate ligase